MADPLSVLRDYCMGNKLDQVRVAQDGRVYFSDQYSFPKTSYTAFKSGAPNGDFYDLGTVFYFITLFAASETQRLAEYVAGCKQRHIKPVQFVDRKVSSAPHGAFNSRASIAPYTSPAVEGNLTPISV